jgi:hypothetical protein
MNRQMNCWINLGTRVTVTSLFTSLVTLAFLSACQQTKQLDEMHDSTIEMKDTTKKMNDGLDKQLEVTNHMEKKLGSQLEISESMGSKLDQQLEISNDLKEVTQVLATTTDSTYLDLRQGNGRTIRRDELINLQNAKTLDAKFTAAAAYLTAFEFQLIKPGLDDKEGRQAAFYATAAEEFLRDVNETFPKPWNFPMVDEVGNVTQNAYAIAGALHFINPNTEAACKQRNEKCLSMLDLLETALKEKQRLDQSKDPEALEKAPAFVKKVLEQEEAAVYLLKLRFILLTSVVINKASPAGEAGISKMKSLLRGGRLLVATWSPSLEKANSSQLKQLIEAVDSAHQVYDFLLSIRKAPTLPILVKAAFQTLRPTTAKPTAMDAKNTDSNRQILETQVVVKLAELQSLVKNSDCASNVLLCKLVRGSAPH